MGCCTAWWRSRAGLRDVRVVEAATGVLDGVEVRLLAAELRPASLATVRRYEGAAGAARADAVSAFRCDGRRGLRGRRGTAGQLAVLGRAGARRPP